MSVLLITFRLIDSLKECSYSSDTTISYLSVTCVTELIASLEKIATGNCLSDELTEIILDKTITAVEVDLVESNRAYSHSPISNLTVVETQTTSEPSFKLDLKVSSVADYKNKLGTMLNSMKVKDEELKSQCSGIEDNLKEITRNCECDEDADRSSSSSEEVYLNELVDEDVSESSETGARLRRLLERESYFDRSRPIIAIDSLDEVARKERENARCFLKELRLELNKWISLKNFIEVDDIMQLFASNYCKSNVLVSIIF